MKIIRILFLFNLLFFINILNASEITFDQWLKNFRVYALDKNITEITFDKTMSNVVFFLYSRMIHQSWRPFKYGFGGRFLWQWFAQSL